MMAGMLSQDDWGPVVAVESRNPLQPGNEGLRNLTDHYAT